MRKLILSKAILLAALFSAATINAQTESKLTAINSPSETPSADKSNKFLPFNAREVRIKKTFDADKNLPARQQTYVRPTKEQRLKRYLSDAFGVPALIGSTFGATINQIGNDPPEWRRNAGGFGKRFASSYGTNAIRNTVSYGLSEAFKLDNRFERSGQKNVGKRLRHVFLGSYTTRTRNGKRIPDFPFVAGTYTASIIANEVWYPNRFSYKDGIRDGTISLGVRFGVNLLREFIFPK